jgi:acetyl-CoA/propionyl-CoA/long-chain acyl-CoA carboxylase, biotin carboxylase, biotin carboxyl carrier protein
MGAVQRLLIANRGEIAVRIARACREAGVGVVALTGPGDADAVHVTLADEARLVPSYLDGDAIVAAAIDAGADAVHPGYGFLSERAGFAEAVLAAGLTWVGPPPQAMRILGDKVGARALAEGTGVPIVPGFAGPDLTDAALLRAGEQLGPPLLVKAAGGGGGRGMRAVGTLADLPGALESARAEAGAAFGDDRIFLERRLVGVRHVEVQVLLDAHGSGVHLGDRDCSLQRRHQKIVEEAPAPGLEAPLRAALGEAALTIAREAGYQGVGTAEFLLDADGTWRFLEMNARLQVEHPVTEAVTGFDIVRAQLRVAGGEPLWVTQDDVRPFGHAIEARVYAEDPTAGFMPAAGRVDRLSLPHWPGVRIDTALRQGDLVQLDFDPLLAKVIAVAADRDTCLDRLRAVLAEVRIVGVSTNLGFLLDALDREEVRAGRAETDWVTDSWVPEVPPLPAGVHPGGDPADPWRSFGDVSAPIDVTVAGHRAQYRGWAYELAPDELEPVPIAPPGGSLAAPMPASVGRVAVAVGDEVEAGQVAVVLEAMKMQMRVDVPAAGIVRAVHVTVGDVVVAGQSLVEVEER